MTHPIFIRSKIHKLDLAYAAYKKAKVIGNDNMDDYWLTKADCLAGDIVKMRESLIG